MQTLQHTINRIYGVAVTPKMITDYNRVLLQKQILKINDLLNLGGLDDEDREKYLLLKKYYEAEQRYLATVHNTYVEAPPEFQFGGE